VTDREHNLIKTLRATDPSIMKPAERLDATQWIAMYYNAVIRQASTEPEYKKALKEYEKDSHVMWKLLDLPPNTKTDGLWFCVCLRVRVPVALQLSGFS
jgi:hypothetical protein